MASSPNTPRGSPKKKRPEPRVTKEELARVAASLPLPSLPDLSDDELEEVYDRKSGKD